MTTFLPGARAAEDTEARAWLPEVSMRNGALALEHGLHQEIGWERRTDASGMAVLVYADTIENPVVEARGHFAAGESVAARCCWTAPAAWFTPPGRTSLPPA